MCTVKGANAGTASVNFSESAAPSAVCERVEAVVPSAKDSSTMPWVEKYRPTELSHIVHHDVILRILRTFLHNHSMPHLFFYGPPGTGKTSTILSCAKEIYGKHSSLMVLHLNASDERGVDIVRKRIIQFASTANMFCVEGYKLIVLDEADSMTTDAQIALRDILMTYSSNARFCLIGNYQYSLIPSLQSRMVKLLFTPVPLEQVLIVVERILSNEGVKYEPEAVQYLYTIVGGDLRKYINVLQSLCLRVPALTKIVIEEKLCRWKEDEMRDLIRYIRAHTLKESYEHIQQKLQNHTQDFMSWLQNIFEMYLKYMRDDDDLQAFCDEISIIEYNSSSVVYYDVQLFCFTACCHKYAKRLTNFD